MITWGQAKKIVRRYAGVAGSCNPEDLDIFLRKVLQYLLYSGEHGAERKFCFHAHRGCFTLPYELETPLKVKIGSEVGQVWSRWFEYHSGVDLDDCLEAGKALYEEPNLFPTVYDLPPDGAFVCTLGTCTEDPSSNIIVKGLDTTGREVYTIHKGEKIHGEYLSIVKGKRVKSTVKFGKINEVSKSTTNGYVQLYWITEDNLRTGFLADYDPYEENPTYRRVRIKTPCAEYVKISVIGRIRLKTYYADNDRLPFDNYFALDLAAQTIHSSRLDDVQAVSARDQQLQSIIEREANFKKVNTGIPLDIYRGTSPGRIRKVVGAGFRRFWNRGV